MDITFRQLEIFRSVVVAGSITKASQKIGLSQPSISQQLQKLEEMLNVQLIVRNRKGAVSLTPAGEFWYRSAGEVLTRMAEIETEHEQRFRTSNVRLRLGVTPALRGRFTAEAARIAQMEPSFVKFEMIYELNSDAVVERLRMHHVNFAIVAEVALASEISGFATARLFEDGIAWAVPACVSEEEILYALSPGAVAAKVHPLLKAYVEIDPAVPTRAASDDWFRSHLPFSKPLFGAPTFATTIEFVADGLGTGHVLMSLLPNLSEHVRHNVRLYRVEEITRTVVLAVRKHLLTHPSYARIFNGIVEFAQREFAPEMASDSVQSFAALLARAQGKTPPETAVPNPARNAA